MGSQSILVLQNPGSISRFYLDGIVRSARHSGFNVHVFELGPYWQLSPPQAESIATRLEGLVTKAHVGAVVSYCWNSVFSFPARGDAQGRPISFFGDLGIPELLLWTDHPQWFNNSSAIQPQALPLLHSATIHHFLKDEAAASEIRHFLGWPNCHAIAMAENLELLHPEKMTSPEYDVVCIGLMGDLDPSLEVFLSDENPDMNQILRSVADRVRLHLTHVWKAEAPAPWQAKLNRFGDAWVALHVLNSHVDPFRHFLHLQRDFPEETEWLQQNWNVYFPAARAFWQFGAWQRPFYLRYLARHFKVRMFGRNSQEMIPYLEQARTYARGKVAINVSLAHDYEGLTHKPFQIAASGVPMVHVRKNGLTDCFRAPEEVGVFSTPAEARDLVESLLANDARRHAMAEAAMDRLQRDHTWAHRLTEMLEKAGLSVSDFKTEEASRP